ncbi:hypothetical protein NLI96_g5850 [Meripilus lineatus]|uniref:Uncharacterized protein n=1 Tax=Meripilus lineatus TaxID=2056292 RepID=A0AAD5V221_9APHY|nr:hypothetical protein NLI96_g5850 [Physisporinus lineatus]
MPENSLPFRPHRLDPKRPPTLYLHPRRSFLPLTVILNIHRKHLSKLAFPLRGQLSPFKTTLARDRPSKIIPEQLTTLSAPSGSFSPLLVSSLTQYIVRANTLSAFFTVNSDVRTRLPSFPSQPVHYTPPS